MSWFEIVILAFVEGLTEFLPISSTGHLILTSAVLNLHHDIFVQHFNIVIQMGAISAVLFEYRNKFFKNLKEKIPFYLRLVMAFLPIGTVGFLFKNQIDLFLDRVDVVAWALVLGGILLIYLDRLFEKKQSLTEIDINTLSLKQSLMVGVIQTLALIPGVSRAASAIVGGLFVGMNRKQATEYSFFLAVPTLMAAGLYKLLKIAPQIESNQIMDLFLGTLLSFIFALAAIRFFIQFVSRHGFKYFGYYRIVLGVTILLTMR